MSRLSLFARTLSTFLLLLMLFLLIAPNAMVKAAPDTALPFLDDFTGGVAPTGFVGFLDAWDGSGSANTLVLTYPLDTLPTIPTHDNTNVITVTYDVTHPMTNWGGGQGYGGVSRDFATTLDLSGYQALRFWFKGGNTGSTMRVELKSGGANSGVSNRFEYSFTDNFSDWRYFSIPFSSFIKRTDYNPGAGLGDSLDLTLMWGYSILIPGNTTGVFSLDEVSVTGYDAGIVGFTGGTAPAGFGAFLDAWDGSGSANTLGMSYNTDNLPTIPAQNSTDVLTVTYDITHPMTNWGGGSGYGGVTYPFGASEDWSNYQGLSFWYKGGNTGGAMRIELKTAGASAGASNLFQYEFTDNFSNWRFFNIPWSAFTKRTDYNPGAALGDSIDFTTIWGYSVLIPNVAGSFSMDNISPYGGGNDVIVPNAQFSASTYAVDENGGTATITVKLSAATTVDVSVDYATSNGTATSGVEYTAASGTLNFTAGETSKTFTVDIADNSDYNAPTTVNLALSNPVNATLGTTQIAVLTILDDDVAPDIFVVDDYSGSVAPIYNPFNTAVGFAIWGSESGNVQLSTATVADTDPLALPAQSGDVSLLQLDYNIGSWGGFTHALEDGNNWVSQDWSRYDGISFWLYGNNTGGTIQTEIFDNQKLGSTGDSAERYYYRITDNYTGWKFFRIPFSLFQRRADYQPGGAPNDGLNLTQVSGYAFGLPAGTGATTSYLADYSLYGDLAANSLTLRVESAAYAYGADEGKPVMVKVALNDVPAAPVSVDYAITPDTAVAGINYDDSNATGTLNFAVGETEKTVVITTINDGKIKPTLFITVTLSNPSGSVLGWKEWATVGISNTNTPDPSIIDDFENGLPVPANLPANPDSGVTFTWEEILSNSTNAIPGQFPVNYVLSGDHVAGASFNRLIAPALDLTDYNALRFWYKGSNSGQPVVVTVLDGQPDPGPSGWTLAWGDDFDGAVGTAPDATFWNHDIGGWGWGNNEWEYYTDSVDNAALDGTGNLVITAKPEDTNTTTLECDYGPDTNATGPQPCAYTSARLLTKDKIDFAYGRVEARIKIPYGQGIWPAFWMLGSDIENNPWPGSGEIDIMENIGKASEQTNLYGTIHGPGYSGGSNIGSGPFDTGVTLHDDFHTYAIEWEPTEIRWYFDGVQYFSVTPADLPADTQWVFNKPFFIIMNVAVGGNWPGYPDGTTTFPQAMTVDYVHVYQGPDTAQRFESTFMDDSNGWKLVTLPLDGFTPSATQPAGALNNAHPVLTNVQGYGFELPNTTGNFMLDDVRGATSSFTDTDVTYWASYYIEKLFNSGITAGCLASPLRYCPEAVVTRAQMAVFLERGIHGASYVPLAASGTVFADVSSGYWAASWIEALKADGITNGCTIYSYCPDSPVTRAEMAIFLLRTKYGKDYMPPTVGGNTGFNDVDVSYWAAAWIKQLAAEGITSGCGSGQYCPDQPVTRAQMAVFLVRTFNLP